MDDDVRPFVPIVFPECKICSILVEEASAAVRDHLRALAALENAVGVSIAENIITVESGLALERERSQNALNEIWQHLASEHGKKREVTANRDLTVSR